MKDLPAYFLAVTTLLVLPAQSAETWKFDFGSGAVAPGYKQVTSATVYSAEKGYGFLAPLQVTDVDRKSADPLHSDFCTSDTPFIFAIDLPEGNYQVKATLGDSAGESTTTIKAESRRLMVEQAVTASGQFDTRTFTVNVHTPKIKNGGEVSINTREKGPPIVPHWDDKLTLEFNGKRPCIDALEITPIDTAVTVYLAGDSTVTDQPHEPWTGWGQMLPRFFQPSVAVSNHAESGLALYSFKGGHRLDKILSTIKKGDYLFIQFGHNDQKDKSPGAGPFTSYKKNLAYFVDEARKKDGTPVLVTPMERRRLKGGTVDPTLADYAEAVRQVATEKSVPLIDLNAMSIKLYEALGNQSTKAFVHYPANTFPGQLKPLKDDTHSNAYGGYEFARCLVEGIKTQIPDLAKLLQPDIKPFDPAKPDPVDEFDVPASVFQVTEKPAGN